MRIKTLRLHLTANIMAKSRKQPTMNSERLESSMATLKIIVENPHSTKNNLPYDPAIPIFCIHSKDSASSTCADTCSAIFTATYSWKPSKCPSTDS